MADASNLPPADDVSVVTDDIRINEDEREEIEREIDALVSEGGSESTLPPEFLQPRRNGFGLPLLIWILAGAAFAGGFLYISKYFAIREETITLESRGYFTAEAQLIEEILRESEERLAEKDQEIDQIQGRLAQLDAEKQNLQQNLEEQVAERAAELRAQLEAELAAERARLADAGESEAEIEARLAELETEREAEVAAQIDAFREQAQEELAELRGQLEAQEAQLEQTLASSREERERLAREAAEREAELREQFTEEIAELEEAERTALERVDELQRLQEQQTLLTDRVLGSFTVIVQDIEEGLTEEALEGLDSLERLLLDQGLTTGGIREQRRTELALVSTLRSLVQEVDVLRDNIAIRDLTTTQGEAAQVEQERAAELIRSAADTVALAENARVAGRYTEARSLYQQALATIPSLEQVYPGILDLESERRQVALQGGLSEAQSLLAAGNAQQAVSRYLESIRTIAADDEDPVLDVATGISQAVSQNTSELLAVQESLTGEFQSELAEREQQVAALTRDLNASRNALATAQETLTLLRSQLAQVQSQLDESETLTGERTAQIAALREEVAGLEDDLSGAQTDLAAARSRSQSLQTSLSTAQGRAAELEAQIAALEQEAQAREGTIASSEDRIIELDEEIAELREEVASLEQELAERPERAPEDEEPQVVPEATQEELAELNATIAEREERIEALETLIEERDAELDRVREELAGVRDNLAAERSTTDELRAELDESATQIAGLQERIQRLQESRTTTAGETQQLEEEVARLSARVDELEELESSIQTLSREYEGALATAQRRIQTGDYARARSTILGPFASEVARELFAGFVTTLDTAHENIVTGARDSAAGATREETLDNVTELADQVQQNIAAPRESIAVQSYLNREPDLRPVADELFEIVELSARAISAPEVEYRLLGSVSRVTGNLVVVERLVQLEAEVGDTVEVRRAPNLGQEVAIASGTILEVTDRRVVVSVDEIFELETPPATRDLVYIAQE
ncbi:MAG: hypothetical protein ACOC1U_06525 [Spirochaetota bacterium]